MSNDLRELTDFFKDRIDELCLLEERISKQAEALGIVSKNCIAANESHINKMLLRIDSATHSIDRINHAAEKVDGHISFCTKHMKFASWIFFGSLFLAACIWIATYFWCQGIVKTAKEANIEVAQAEVALKNKPIFLSAANNLSGDAVDYVRIVPNTQGTMTHSDGEPYPGVYAEVWTRNKSTDRDWLNQ